MLVSLGIKGLWLLLSAQFKSQSNILSVLYDGFFQELPGEQMPSYFQESQPLAELSLFLLLLPTWDKGSCYPGHLHSIQLFLMPLVQRWTIAHKVVSKAGSKFSLILGIEELCIFF